MVGPGAHKPSGNGKESSRLLVHSHWYINYMYVWFVCMCHISCACKRTLHIKVQRLGMSLAIEVSLHM